LPQGYVQNAHHIKDWCDRIEAGQLATVRGVAFTPEYGLRSDIIERLMCDLKADVPAAPFSTRIKPLYTDLDRLATAPLNTSSDVVFLAPSHPVVSVGAILAGAWLAVIVLRRGAISQQLIRLPSG